MRWRMALPAAAAIGACITIASASGVLPAWWAFVFKPLTTLTVIAYAWPRGAADVRQRRWILAGLCLSLVGDVFLLWPTQGFVPGLVSFLLAHLAYIAALCAPLRFAARPLPFVLYAATAALLLSILWPGIPAALRVPVVAYVLCLASMTAQAAAWWRAARGTPAEHLSRNAALGGLLFMLSDTLLAFNKFAAPLPWPALWILLTYWPAQWCIASSLRGAPASSSPE
jgi:uncharacterized membrane protein YhhN